MQIIKTIITGVLSVLACIFGAVVLAVLFAMETIYMTIRLVRYWIVRAVAFVAKRSKPDKHFKAMWNNGVRALGNDGHRNAAKFYKLKID
jgi:hypothetical protein